MDVILLFKRVIPSETPLLKRMMTRGTEGRNWTWVLLVVFVYVVVVVVVVVVVWHEVGQREW